MTKCKKDCPHRRPACQDTCEILAAEMIERRKMSQWLHEKKKLAEIDIYHIKNPSYVRMNRKKKNP